MEEYNEISIKDIMIKIWNKKIIILAILAISILLGIIYSFIFVNPMYKSDTQILIDKNDASIEMFSKSYEIANEIANALNVTTDYIQQNVEIRFNKQAKIITVIAKAEQAELACNIVNEYIKILQPKLETVYENETYNNLQQPKIATEPYNINYINNIMIFSGIGLIIVSIYLIFAVNGGENEDIRKIKVNKLMCIGKIEKEKGNTTYITKKESIIDEFKKIIANIEFNKMAPKPSTILVTGIQEEVGTSYVVTNLALRYAKAQKKVLIIDSDLNKGTQSTIFNIKQTNGLTELISSKNNMDNIDINKYTKKVEENVYIMTSGQYKIDEELLVSVDIKGILEILKQNFDVILIDGNPICKSSTSIIWSNAVETTLIVLKYNGIKMKMLNDTKENIIGVNGKISGVILNKVI